MRAILTAILQAVQSSAEMLRGSIVQSRYQYTLLDPTKLAGQVDLGSNPMRIGLWIYPGDPSQLISVQVLTVDPGFIINGNAVGDPIALTYATHGNLLYEDFIVSANGTDMVACVERIKL